MLLVIYPVLLLVCCGVLSSVDRLGNKPSTLGLCRQFFKFMSMKNIMLIYERRYSGHFTAGPVIINFRAEVIQAKLQIASVPASSAERSRLHPIAARGRLHVDYVAMLVISPPSGSGRHYNNTILELHLRQTIRISAKDLRKSTQFYMMR